MTLTAAAAVLAMGLFTIVALRIADRIPPAIATSVPALGSVAAAVLVIDSDRLEAFATPSPVGRIVITSPLPKVMTPTSGP